MMQRRSNAADKTVQAQPLTAIDSLLKPTAWERLSEAERGRFTALYPALDARAEHAEPLLRAAAPDSIQNWIAAIVGRAFQPQIAAGIANWLDTAPENAHLYLGGDASIGTPQLVAALARQKLAQWPAPSSYCFTPDPATLDQPLLLTLPLGTADTFGKAIADTFRALGQQWSDPATNQQAINTLFAALSQAVPGLAPDYLASMRNALLQLAAAGAAFPWAGENNAPPMGSVTPEPSVTTGAPVVDATSSTTSLIDAVLQANGGVLIVSSSTSDIGKLLPLLLNREISLQDGWPTLPLNLRVVLLGTSDIYDDLWSHSDVIGQIFRYELWSQSMTPWTQESEAAYAALTTGVAAYYGLLAPTPAAISHLIQEGSRRADGINQNRLSVDLLMLHDIVIEAAKSAKSRAAANFAGEDIDDVIDRRRAQQHATVYWVQEDILSGESITPTAGAAIGQINGLGVFEVHPWEGTFAVPMRISATVVPAQGEQLLDIEREANQTDGSHIRGLLTMEGYFANQYGQKYLLGLAARIRFEQEQGSTGGDSASVAELCALLSALSGIPIRRSIAVTGAIGQYGELQPIGGVNFKIEGFWDLCRIRRSRGEIAEGGYGVLIPATNANDLMLRGTVARSIASEGWFQVWLATSIDDALPVLMGVPASTVHDRVEQRLRAYSELLRKRR